MTEEVKKDVGQTDSGAEPKPNEGQTQAADAGGRPDSVWRDHRVMEKTRKSLADKGWDFDRFLNSVDQIPSAEDVANYQPPAEMSYGGAGIDDEYLTKREATALVKEITKLSKELGDIKNESASERLDREAQATGLVAVLQEAYKALRIQNPDADPKELRKKLDAAQDEIVQSRIKQAKEKQDQPAPTVGGAQNPVVEPEGDYKGTPREQFAQWKQKVRDSISSTLQGGG